MTTVVTGGAGFLGRRVIARLLDSGEDVVSLDVAPRSVESPRPGVRELRADVTSFDEVVAIFGAVRPSRVIHLAYLLNRDEVAGIFTTLALTERPRQHVYNTGGTAISLQEIAELVRKAIPDASISFDSAEGARASAGTYLIDNTRLLDEFGFAYRPYVDQVQSIIDAVRGLAVAR